MWRGVERWSDPGWKFCSDTGLSALPAAISERCHRYGDCRVFSLIIGNCEPVSVPVHRYTYSYFNDTCQRSRLLQTWWAQQLLQGNAQAYVWPCTHARTHGSLQMSGVISAVNRLEVKLFTKEAWRKRVLTRDLSRCLRLTKQKLTYNKWNSGEAGERNKLEILFAEGCLRACIWCYRYRLMVSHLEVILGDDAPGREAWSRLIAVSWITCSCLHHKAARTPRVGSSVASAYVFFFIAMKFPHFRCMSLHNHVLYCVEINMIAERRDLLVSI